MQVQGTCTRLTTETKPIHHLESWMISGCLNFSSAEKMLTLLKTVYETLLFCCHCSSYMADALIECSAKYCFVANQLGGAYNELSKYDQRWNNNIRGPLTNEYYVISMYIETICCWIIFGVVSTTPGRWLEIDYNQKCATRKGILSVTFVNWTNTLSFAIAYMPNDSDVLSNSNFKLLDVLPVVWYDIVSSDEALCESLFFTGLDND